MFSSTFNFSKIGKKFVGEFMQPEVTKELIKMSTYRVDDFPFLIYYDGKSTHLM